jgi:hypothetical protein
MFCEFAPETVVISVYKKKLINFRWLTIAYISYWALTSVG